MGTSMRGTLTRGWGVILSKYVVLRFVRVEGYQVHQIMESKG